MNKNNLKDFFLYLIVGGIATLTEWLVLFVLDKILEESINNCYSDFHWLDTYTIDDKGKVFNISDFIKCFQQTFDEIRRNPCDPHGRG